jgi:hypothetical protein
MRSIYMTPSGKYFDIEHLSGHFEPPILIVSTIVGRGMYSIGEAIQERLRVRGDVYHVPVEEFVSSEVVNEDLKRYKFISNNFPFLLYLVYKIPLFYYRKYVREKTFASPNLQALERKIESLQIRTVICVSHRPAFWVSALKRRRNLDISVWGVLGEYGKNLGWKYQFWPQVNGFLSPIDRAALGFPLPDDLIFQNINLPARREYHELSATKGDKNRVLLVCGFWGQGPIMEVLRELSGALPDLKIDSVCGENVNACDKIRAFFGENSNVRAYGVVSSLAPFLRECGSVITKPGIATLIESHAARRKIFLLKGMPVAEDNNARFATRHLGAQWFDLGAFRSWHAAQ